MQQSTDRIPNLSADVDITKSSGKNIWLDQGFTWLVLGFSGITVGLLFWMSWIILQNAYPAIQKFGLGFLGSQEWNINDLKFGALPYIYGTLVSSGLALLLATPIGLAVALITSEDLLPQWVRSPLAFMIELIAAIPSVIIG